MSQRIWSTQEGKILLSGFSLTLIYILMLSLYIFFFKQDRVGVFSTLSAHLLSGRAGGISLGIEFNLPKAFLIVNASLIDLIIVMIFFPIFVLSYKNYLKSKFINRLIKDSVEAAEKNKEKIKKFKIIGLILFVWFPLHMTGPLVGSIIGFFLEIKHKYNILIVAAGTFLAAFSWVVFFGSLSNLLNKFSFLIPLIIFLTIIIFLIIRKLNKNNQ